VRALPPIRAEEVWVGGMMTGPAVQAVVISREFADGPLSTHRVESGPFFLVLAHVVELIVFTPT